MGISPFPVANVGDFEKWVRAFIAMGRDPAEIFVTLRGPQGSVVRFPACVEPGPEPPAPQGRLLSALGVQILGVLTDAGDWLKADAIAKRMGDVRASCSLRAVLHDMAERGVVEAAPGRGYRAPASALR